MARSRGRGRDVERRGDGFDGERAVETALDEAPVAQPGPRKQVGVMLDHRRHHDVSGFEPQAVGEVVDRLGGVAAEDRHVAAALGPPGEGQRRLPCSLVGGGRLARAISGARDARWSRWAGTRRHVARPRGVRSSRRPSRGSGTDEQSRPRTAPDRGHRPRRSEVLSGVAFTPSILPHSGRCAPKVEDDAGIDAAALDLADGVVHVVELALLADHLGAPVGVQLEGLGEVDPGADDRAGHGDARSARSRRSAACIALSAGRPTNTSRPPRRSERNACSNARRRGRERRWPRRLRRAPG